MEGRELASAYRRIDFTASNIDISLYRGIENCTLRRQRQKILSNHTVVFANNKEEMNDIEIASLYKACNTYSTEIAPVQSIIT
jgi:hypothetical protein